MKHIPHLFLILVMVQMTVGCSSTSSIRTTYGKKFRGTINSAGPVSVTIDGRRVMRSEIKSISYAGTGLMGAGIVLTIVGGVVTGTMMAGDPFFDGILGVLGVPFLAVGVPMWIVGAGQGSLQRQIVANGAKLGMFQTPQTSSTYNLTLRF